MNGLWRLIRLALRRDRWKLPIWLLVIIGTASSMPAALTETYGTEAARESYSLAIGTNVVGRMFGGLLDDTSLGSVMMVEAFAFISVLVMVMNSLLIVRHTRANEETGSMELIQSARVGRFAPLGAALIIALGTNIIVAVGIATVFNASGDLPTEGNWLFGIAQGAIGMSMAALGAIAVQLFSSARVTSVFLSLSIGVMYLLRALGDGFARTVDGKLESLWPTWLSPLGWGQQIYPYTRQDIWVLGLFAGFIVVSVAIGFWLLTRRDVGQGLLADRPAPPKASALLSTQAGLAWRLQRVTLFGWTATIAVLGLIYGGIANQVETLAKDNPVLKQYVTAVGGEGKLMEAFFGTIIALASMTVIAYVAQALGRLQSEETSGRLESVLATHVNKYRWLGAHTLIVSVGSVLLLAVSGATMGLASTWATNGDGSQIGEFTIASLAYTPAVLLCAAVILLVFTLAPRLTSATGWLIFGVLIGLNQIGALLDLPKWVLDLSPFAHIPAAPLEDIVAKPLLIIGSIALGVAVLAFVRFRMRSIVSN